MLKGLLESQKSLLRKIPGAFKIVWPRIEQEVKGGKLEIASLSRGRQRRCLPGLQEEKCKHQAESREEAAAAHSTAGFRLELWERRPWLSIQCEHVKVRLLHGM